MSSPRLVAPPAAGAAVPPLPPPSSSSTAAVAVGSRVMVGSPMGAANGGAVEAVESPTVRRPPAINAAGAANGGGSVGRERLMAPGTPVPVPMLSPSMSLDSNYSPTNAAARAIATPTGSRRRQSPLSGYASSPMLPVPKIVPSSPWATAAANLKTSDDPSELRAIWNDTPPAERKQLVESVVWQERGDTALIFASRYGRLNTITMLMEELGADIEARNAGGATALCVACLEGQFALVVYLVEQRHAKLDVTTLDGRTALYSACLNGQLKVAKYLVENRGCNIETPNSNGRTPLAVACYNGHLSLVKYLAEERGANVNSVETDGTTPLHIACQNAHFDIVKYLVGERKANVGAARSTGSTPLYVACQEGRLNITKYLVDDCGADIHVARIDCGWTPLHAAVCYNHSAIASFLLEHGAAANTPTTSDCEGVPAGSIPADIARMNGNVDLLTLLSAASPTAPTSLSPVTSTQSEPAPITQRSRAASTGVSASPVSPSMVAPRQPTLAPDQSHRHLSIPNGSPIRRKLVSTASAPSLTAVMQGPVSAWTSAANAAKTGDEPSPLLTMWKVTTPTERKELVESVVWPERGDTALIFAARYGRLRIVQALVEQLGANVEARNIGGATALCVACLEGQFAVVLYLVEKCHADLTVTTIDGRTPLYGACLNGQLPVVKYLVESRGCNLEVPNANGRTPLGCACYNGHFEVVKYLAEHGANVESAENDGTTPLHIACQTGHFEIVKYLVGDRGASIEAVRASGATALYICCQEGHVDIAKYLVDERGANIEAARMDCGWKPIHAAVSYGHEAVVLFLLQAGADTTSLTTGMCEDIPAQSSCLDIARRMQRTKLLPLFNPHSPLRTLRGRSASQAVLPTQSKPAGPVTLEPAMSRQLQDVFQALVASQVEYESAKLAVSRGLPQGLAVVDSLALDRESKRSGVLVGIKSVQAFLDALEATHLEETELASQCKSVRGNLMHVRAELDEALDKTSQLQLAVMQDQSLKSAAERREDATAVEQLSQRVTAAEEALQRATAELQRHKHQQEALMDTLKCIAGRGFPEAIVDVSVAVPKDPVASILSATGLLIPHSLADFQVLADSMPTTLHAHPSGAPDQETVALKRVPSILIPNIARESLDLHRLRHPCVHTAALVFVDGHNAYFQSPWRGGGDLKTWLQSQHSSRAGFEMARDISRGLHELHSRNAVHGNLKPTNVLLSDDGRPAVADFGVSAIALGTASSHSTVAGGCSREYAAPELLATVSRQAATMASDMFSLGVLFDEIAAACDTDDSSLHTKLVGLAKRLQSGDPAKRPLVADILHVLHEPPIMVRPQHVQWSVDRGGAIEEYPNQAITLLERAYAQFTAGGGKAKGDQVLIRTMADQNVWVSLRYMHEVAADGSHFRVFRSVPISYPYPPQWIAHAPNTVAVRLSTTTEEYAGITRDFVASMPAARVVNVVRIQNRYWWQRFSHERVLLSHRHGPGEIDMKMLYHGTSAVHPSLVYDSLEGIDFRRSGGLYYGKGAYFSPNAALVHRYKHANADGSCSILVSRVLCSITKMNGTVVHVHGVRPPTAEPTTPAQVATANPSGFMFVVYDLAKSYPQYMITYKL